MSLKFTDLARPAALASYSLIAITAMLFSHQPLADTNNINLDSAIYSDSARHHPVWASKGMVASQEAIATKIGVDILKQGGNAVDAAVAMGYALAVTLPRAGNIGGGGFMMVYLAKENRTIAIDYREMAPSKAHRDMFLDKYGNAVSKLSRFHGLAVGIPGTVMGLQLALEKYGSMSTKQVIAPAIKLARDGIIMTADLANSLRDSRQRLSQWPSSKAIFFKSDGNLYLPGDLFRQPELAHSLSLISKYGSKGFYEGETARRISHAVVENGGVLSVADFKAYRAVEREAVMGTYRGYTIASMPAPSSGGIHLVQMLNTLEQFPIGEMGHNSADTIHVMTEAMRRAYADRSHYLGDPDFVKIPVKALTSKTYGKMLAKQIDMDKATLSKDISATEKLPYESDQTTHYSIIDQFGNAVSNTYTLNFSYGSGIVANGTGILLNNEMDDFSTKPGTPNGYGLIGGESNAVASYKRPLSSMTPTIVLKDGRPYFVTGTPGGSRIITTTLQVIMNVIDHSMNIAEANAAARIHHQWLPDILRVEQGISLDTLKLLRAKGHHVEVKDAMGSSHTVMLSANGVFGASDTRQASSLSKGH